MLEKLKKGAVILRNNLSNHNKVIFISEPINWVIEEICFELKKEINRQYPFFSSVSYSPLFLRDKVIHFASVGTLLKNDKMVDFHKSNKAILSWYHVLDDDPRLSFVEKLNQELSKIHTSCNITKNKLISLGFQEEKIVLISEGIDLNSFTCYGQDKRLEIRRKLSFPEDKIIIGSFQKDGVGWGEGNEPKLEKGPDVFCDVIEKLKKDFDIHVLLTGPSRGYVKNRLNKAGVSFTHVFLKNYSDIVEFYNALDLYLIASRVEGGPKSLLESWACGVPVVSTKVGMSADHICLGENGLLSEIEDIDGLVRQISLVLNDGELRGRIIKKGLDDVRQFDWSLISQQYMDKIYKPLL